MFFKRRTKRKKKRLRSRIKILSFPGQVIKATYEQNKKVDSNESLSVVLKVREKSSTPTGNNVNYLLNVNDSLKQIEQEKKVPKEIIYKNKKEISKDLLILNWKKYIQQLKDEGHEAFFNILNKTDPYLKDVSEIYYNIEEKAHFELIKNHHKEIENNLKILLENDLLNLHFNLLSEDSQRNRKLNSRELFEELSKKNANLLFLKQIFNLDIE
ncbi:MAG: hypothetical protein HYU67_02575 [Flavobacteriia bacterium]|nr:hypothetical protein [Flavobacteriia bacterium]